MGKGNHATSDPSKLKGKPSGPPPKGLGELEAVLPAPVLTHAPPGIPGGTDAHACGATTDTM